MAQQTQEVEEETAVKDALIAENQTILDEIVAKKNELAKDLDPNLVFKFERIIRNKGGVGIVPVHSIVCEGCHMTLPAQFVNDVRREDEIKFCPYCSRVLYYEESEDSEHLDSLFDASDVVEDGDEEGGDDNDGGFISDDEFSNLDTL